MGRFHKKLVGFYETIVSETEILVNGDNVILSSLTIKKEKIQYCIKTELFLKIADNIYRNITEKGVMTHKEVSDIFSKEIYGMYKTKVAVKKIPYLVLNALVKGNILFSDNGEEYILNGDEKLFIDFLKECNVLKELKS